MTAPTTLPALWAVSADRPVLTSPSGAPFRMAHDRGGRLRHGGGADRAPAVGSPSTG